MKKRKQADMLDIHCEKCREINYKEFEEVVTQEVATIVCKNCGAKIYWKNCPRCETGWYSNDRDCKCPDCEEGTSKTTDKSGNIIRRIPGIAIALVAFGVAAFLSKMLYLHVQIFLFFNNDTIFIAPGELSYWLSFPSALFVLMGGAWIFINVKNKDTGLKQNLIIAVIFFTLPVMSLFNYSAFYKDKIVVNSVFSDASYNYDNISSVHVDYYSKRFAERLKYIIKMDDGEEIDMLSYQGNFKYALVIQNKIIRLNKKIPHTIDKKAYEKLKQRVASGDVLDELFKIVD